MDGLLSLDNFLHVVGGVGGGYLVALLVHFCMGYLVSREGTSVLKSGDCMSRAFYAQLGLSWVFTGAVAALVTLYFFPDRIYGSVMTGVLCLLLCMTILRTHNKARSQQTGFDSALLFLCVALGCAASAYLRLA